MQQIHLTIPDNENIIYVPVPGYRYIDNIFKSWHRYIDDFFIIWDGTVDLLHEFFSKPNQNEFNLTFTMTFSNKKF